jgi:hypothetical protein
MANERIDYLPLIGGLDEQSHPAQPIKGRLLVADNVEGIAGSNGTWTARGYERTDGRALASSATYQLVIYTGVSNAVVGDTVVTAGGSARVIRVDVGSQLLAVTPVAGTLSLGEVMSLGGKISALSNGDQSDPAYKTDIRAARAYLRSLITAVPGQGWVRGVAHFAGDVYALRDAVDGATAALWKSSPAGWVLVRAGLRPGGMLRASAGNTTGATTLAALYGCDGKNRYWRWDGVTFTFGPAFWGTESASNTNTAPALGAKVLNITELAGKVWTAGQQVIVYSSTNAANFMIGTVTAWATPNLSINVTAFGGVAASDWHVCMADGTDRPYNLRLHSNHLMLALPRGQLQTSELGNPMSFGVTSVLIGCAAEITDMVTLTDELLAVGQDKRFSLLYGTSKADFVLKTNAGKTGVFPGSIQESNGDGIFLNETGVRSVTATQSFGNFAGGALSMPAQRSAMKAVATFRASALLASVGQYRVYTSTGAVLLMTSMDKAGRFLPGRVAFFPLSYLHKATCAAVDMVGGQEVAVFGTEDGYVMRDRSGTSYDGALISSFGRMSYWHHDMPALRKRWMKVTMDAISDEPEEVSIRADFDLGGDAYPSSETYTRDIAPAGGRFNESDWNAFYWSEADASRVEAEIDGVGKNISLTFWRESDAEPRLLGGFELLYYPLALQR